MNEKQEKMIIWGLAGIILLLPTYMVRFKIGVPTNLLEILIYIYTVMMLVVLRRNLKEIGREIWEKLRGWKWPLGLFLLSAVISLLVTEDKRAGLGLFKAYFIDPLPIFCSILLIKNKASWRWIFWAFGVSAIWMAVLAMWQYFGASSVPGFLQSPEPWISQTPRRAASIFEYPNALGLYLAPIGAAYAALTYNLQLTTHNKYGKIFVWLVVLASLIGILLANSRGALIGLLLAVIVAGLMSQYKKWVAVGAIILIVISLVATPLPEKINKMMSRKDVSADTRIVLWQNTEYLIKDHWFWGVGLGGFPSVFDKHYRPKIYHEPMLYPHNFVLNFWVELGLTGLIAFLWLMGLYFKQGIAIITSGIDKHREEKVLSGAILAVMIAILVHGLVDVPFFKNDLAIIWWMLIAGAINLKNER